MGVSDSQIYAGLKDDLVRYATALVGPDAAGDVVSTVVLRVLSRGSLEDLREPRAYLFRSVLNESMSSRRRARREVLGEVREPVRDDPEIRPEVMGRVVDKFVREVEAQLQERKIRLELSPRARSWHNASSTAFFWKCATLVK